MRQSFESIVKSKGLSERAKDILIAKDFPDRYEEWLTQFASPDWRKQKEQIPVSPPFIEPERPQALAPVARQVQTQVPPLPAMVVGEPPPVDFDLLSTAIFKLYPEISTSFGEDGTPEHLQQAVSSVQQLAQEDTDAFLDDLLQKGRSPESEYLLSTIFGATPEDIEQFFGGESLEATLNKVFPGTSVEDLNIMLQEDVDTFVKTMQTGGRTKEKESLLRMVGASETEIEELLGTQRIVVPIEGIRKLVTVTADNRAFDDKGKWVGTYNPVTKEFASLPDEGIVKDFFDALHFGTKSAILATKGFFTRTLPNLLFRDFDPQNPQDRFMRNAMGDAWVEKMNTGNQQARDTFRRIYAKDQREFETWRVKHPELEPQNWVMEAVGSAPLMVASLAATMTGVLTRNPALIWGGLAIMTPAQTFEVEEALLAAGASEEEASQWAVPVGGVISGIEVFGRLPYLRFISPSILRVLRGKMTKEMADAVVTGMGEKALKRGLKVAGFVSLTETLEEVTQQAVQNAAVKAFDENQSLFEGLGESARGALLLTLPLSIIFGGVSMVRVSPSQTKGLTEVEMKAKGWIQDPKNLANWYAPISGAAEEEIAPTEAVPVTPEVTAKTLLDLGRSFGNRLLLEEMGVLSPASSQLTISEIVMKLNEIQAKLDKIPTSRSGGPQFRKLDNARITLLRVAERESGLSETGLRNVAEGLPPPIVPKAIPEAAKAVPPPVAKEIVSAEGVGGIKKALPPELKELLDDFSRPRTTAEVDARIRAVIEGDSDFTVFKRTDFKPEDLSEVLDNLETEIGLEVEQVGDVIYVAKDKPSLDLAKNTIEAEFKVIPAKALAPITKEVSPAEMEALTTLRQAAGLGGAPPGVRVRPTEAVAPGVPEEIQEAFSEFGIKPGDTITFTPPYSRKAFTGVLQNNGRVIAPDGSTATPNWMRLKPSDMPVTIEAAVPPVEEVVAPPPPVKKVTVVEKLAAAKQTIKELRQKRAEATWVRAELVRVIKEHLPLPRQGELLSKVRDAKTDADLAEASVRVEMLAEVEAEKTLRIDIIKELKKTTTRIEKGIRVGRLSPEVQPILEQLRTSLLVNLKQGIQVNADAYDAARNEIAQNIANYQEGKITSDTMLEANEKLKYVGLYGMSTAQLQETLDYVQELKAKGKDFRKAKRETIKAEAEEIRTQGIGEITGGRGIKPGVGALRPEDLAAAKRILDQPVNSQYGFVNLLDKLGKLTKTEAYKGYLMRFNRAVQQATNTENMERERSLRLVGDKLKEVYKVPKAREVTRLLNTMTNEDVDLGTFKITTIREGVQYLSIKLTKAQMMEAYQLYKNPKNLETFKEGMHWTPEIMTAIVNNLSEQDIAFADWLQEEFYDTYYDKINPFYREEFNIDMPKNPDYVPQSRDFTAKEDNEVTMLLQDQKRYASVTNKSLKARQENIRPFKFNGVFNVATNHIVQMEHFMAWVKPMHELRRFFGNAEVRMAIKQYHSGDIVNRIDTYMNDFARGGRDQAQFLGQLDKVRSRFAVAVLGLKPSIGLQQIWTVGAFMTEMRTGDFVSGFADFWAHPVRNYRWMMENSTYLQQRYTGGNYERDIRIAQQKGGLKALSGQGNISQWFLWQVTQGDKFGVMPGWWAKYQAGLKEGLSQADAMLEADAASERTQNTSEIASLAWLQRGSSWGKLVTMFQSQPNKYFRIIADNIRNMQYGRTSKVKGMTNLFIVWVLLPALFQFVADAFQFKKERQARVLLLGPFNNILVAGQLLQTAWGWFTGDNFEWQASPVLSTVRDAQNFVSKAMKVKGQYEDPFKDVVWDDVVAALEFLAKGVGQLAGLPTPYLVNVEKALRGREGERDYRELIFSRWALETPKSGLAEKAEEALEGFGLPIEEKLEAGRPLSEKPPAIKGMTKINSEYKTMFSKTLPQDITKEKGFGPMAVAWAEKEIARSQADVLPNVALYKINTKDADDDTIVQYYKQWQARTQIKSLPDLVEFDKLYPKAYLGNVTRIQYELLVKYLNTPDKKKGAFLERTPELKTNLRNEWLRVHPKENALLAVFGEAKILSPGAYKEAQRLVKELDIPDAGLPDLTVPPEGSIKGYIEYLEGVERFGGNSAEALLPLVKDDKLRTFLKRDPIETPVAALELKVEHRALFDLRRDYSDPDSPNYLDDRVKDEDELTARDRAIAKLKTDNPKWVEDMRRIEALENEGEDFAEAWVERGKSVDEFGGGSAEAKLWLLDHPDVLKWALDKGLLSNDLSDEKLPVLRIRVKYRELNELLDSYGDKESPNYLDDRYKDAKGLTARDRAVADLKAHNPEWVDDMRRVEAYQKDAPGQVVELFVQYYKLVKKDGTPDLVKRKAFRKQHPDLDEWGKQAGIWEEPVKEKGKVFEGIPR